MKDRRFWKLAQSMKTKMTFIYGYCNSGSKGKKYVDVDVLCLYNIISGHFTTYLDVFTLFCFLYYSLKQFQV